jgi:glycosyltransferase involved in cell wall biosynthesis
LVLFAGRLSPDKNLPGLLFAIQRDVRESSVTALISGDGPIRDDVVRFVEREGMRDRIIVTGYLPDIWSWMKRAAVFVSLSHTEGMPNAVMEAMGARCPLVLSDIPPHRELLGEDSGCLVPLNDPDTAPKAILEALKRTPLVERQIQAARARAERWSLDAIAQEYAAVYETAGATVATRRGPHLAVQPRGTPGLVAGIDASNIRTGGGLTHLTKLLEAGRPVEQGITRVVVWASRATLERLPERSWLERCHEPLLDRRLPYRLFWQRHRLPRLARRTCDVLFVPGGNVAPGFSPIVAMSRNMLPFETSELLRYGVSLTTLRLILLRLGQAYTFRRADGLIFLTNYAQQVVQRHTRVARRTTVIPHGVDECLRTQPKNQQPLSSYSEKAPLRVLYISIIDMYKHQWHVAEAISLLRKDGLAIALDLVGPAYPRALRRLRRALRRLDPAGHFVRYHGPAHHDELRGLHQSADVFLFASSCENMPNILLEAMASGLPIACADRGPMPEILGDAGVYFDPEQVSDIAGAVRRLAMNPQLRATCAALAYERAIQYSWARCACETFAFIRAVGGDANLNFSGGSAGRQVDPGSDPPAGFGRELSSSTRLWLSLTEQYAPSERVEVDSPTDRLAQPRPHFHSGLRRRGHRNPHG